MAGDTYWSQHADTGTETTAAIDLTKVPELLPAVALADWAMRRLINRDVSVWPADLPQPTNSLTGRNAAVLGIACAAFNFLYLHELAHIALKHHGCNESPELEMDADRQALEWMFGGAEEGSDAHDVASLGAGMGLLLLCIVDLYRLTPSDSHPPSHARLNALDGYISDENHRVWKLLGLALNVQIQSAGESMKYGVQESFRSFVQLCLDVMARRASRRA